MREMKSKLLTVVVIAGLIAATLLSSQTPARAATLPKAGVCHTEQVHVALASGQAEDQTIAGTLCMPLYWAGGQPSVEVLVHGATYNSSYWDFPFDNAQYSYVNDALLAGHATFAYDDIGTGKSSHPASGDINFEADAYILHELLSWVHTQPALVHSKVVVVAHSKGSAVALQTLGTYPTDANTLVVTGFLHGISTAGGALLNTAFYPASQDPQFANAAFAKNDDGYETTVPNTRQALFYSSIANPQVIAYDEAHKDVFSGAEFASGLATSLAPPAQNISNHITVPVLTVVGQQDALFCGAGAADCSSNASVRTAEAPYYQHARSFSALTVPLTGHDIALHPTNALSFTEINTWLSRQ